jgi:hypothetical protein
MRSFPFLVAFGQLLACQILLASEQSVEVEGPCELSCCFDCVCCGPGTKWNELIYRCVPDEAGPDPIPFDWGGKCYLPKCVEDGCCAEGTSLYIDPNRNDAYCVCIPNTSTITPTASPTVSPTGIQTGSPTENPTGSPTGTQTGSPTGSPIGGPTESPSGSQSVSPTESPTGINASMTAYYDGDFCPGCVTECPSKHSFTVIVDNTSPPDFTVCLESLRDTVLGDLNGKGDCSLPQEIGEGGSYTCSFDVPAPENGITVFELIAEGEGYITGEGACGARRSDRRLGPSQQLVAQDLSAQKLSSQKISAPEECGKTPIVGNPTPDGVGNVIRIDCTPSKEYHIMVKEVGEADFKSVGKCPWVGGRNSYKVLSKKNKNGKMQYTRTYWRSLDGALPGVEVTVEQYKKNHNDDKEQEDNNKAWFVDVNEYYFCLGLPVAMKAHSEITLDLQKEVRRGEYVFWVPGATEAVPDDNPLTPALPGRRQLQDLPSDPEMTIVESTLEEGANISGLGSALFNSFVFDVPYDIVNAFPIFSSALARGFFMQFDPAFDSGTGRIQMPMSLLGVLGFDFSDSAAIAIDGIVQPDAARYVLDGFDVFEFEFHGLEPFTAAVLYGLP